MAEEKFDKGWKYLISQTEEGSEHEEDGSWGYKDADGSGSYYGADGSWGYIDTKGNISYYGKNGAWGYKDAEGNGTYYDEDGNVHYFDDDDIRINIDEYDTYSEDEMSEPNLENESFASVLADAIVVTAKLGVAKYTQKKKEEERKELERQQKVDRIRQEIKKKRKEKNALTWRKIKAFVFNGKRISVPCDIQDVIGKKVSYVTSLFEKNAFSNIITVPIKDIYVNSLYEVGQVEQVVVAGSTYFEIGEQVPYDSEIVITYHVKKEIVIPVSGKRFRKTNYIVSGDYLQDLGFTEIYERPIRDLTTGWITKDGSVERVIIGDNDSVKVNSVFPYDVEIVIEYHTFKK